MKRILTIISLLLLIASPVLARITVLVLSGNPPAAESCGSGNLTLIWYGETETITPASDGGCTVANSTTATPLSDAVLAANPHSGTKSVHIPTASDCYNLDNQGTLVVNADEGSLELYIYITDWAANTRIFNYIETVNTDEIKLLMAGGSDTDIEFNFCYEENNGLTCTSPTTDLNGVENTWYRIRVMWRITGDPNFWIEACDTNGENCCTPVSNNTDKTAITDQTTFKLGHNAAESGYYYLDDIKIYDAWMGWDS